MDVFFVNPFVKATVEVFSAMLMIELDIKAPKLIKDIKHTFDISGVIGLSGEAVGIISLSFPSNTAFEVAALLRDEEIKEVDEKLTDAIGELVNIVAGSAKKFFKGYRIQIALPNVVIGKDQKIAIDEGVPLFIVPIESSLGNFAMEVALKTK